MKKFITEVYLNDTSIGYAYDRGSIFFEPISDNYINLAITIYNLAKDNGEKNIIIVDERTNPKKNITLNAEV